MAGSYLANIYSVNQVDIFTLSMDVVVICLSLINPLASKYLQIKYYLETSGGSEISQEHKVQHAMLKQKRERV